MKPYTQPIIDPEEIKHYTHKAHKWEMREVVEEWALGTVAFVFGVLFLIGYLAITN